MTPDITRKFRILSDYYKKEGFLRLCKFVCVNLFLYQKFTVFEKDLSTSIYEVHPKIPTSIRFLSRDENDINRLVEFWPEFYAAPGSTPISIKKTIIKRFSMGEECIVAEYMGEIVHMNWIGFQKTYLFNKYVLKKGVGMDEALSYNIYTDPRYRGNKIVEAVWVEMIKYLKGKNYKNMICYVASQNLASTKVTSRLFKNTCVLYYISIFGFERYFISKEVK